MASPQQAVQTRRAGIVGLGAAARSIHLPACTALADRLEVVGAADPAARGGVHAFPVFSSVDELLSKRPPDLLIVATPPGTHADLCRKGLEAGCHVFCEKPFTETLEEADSLIALARQAQRSIVVNQEFRAMRIHEQARRLIGAPDFGELLFVQAQQTFRVTPDTEAGWRGAERRRTCKDFGIHVLDLCRFFFGQEPIAVSARMPGCGSGPDLLDLITLEFPRDRLAHITLDRLTTGRHRYLDVRLDGSIGCIETSIGGHLGLGIGVRHDRRPYLGLEMTLGGRAQLYKGERRRTIAKDPLNLFASATARLLERFLDALDAGVEPPCSAADNRKTLALMLAAYESAERGAPVAPATS